MRRPLFLLFGLLLAFSPKAAAVQVGGGNSNPGGASYCDQHPNEPACSSVGGGPMSACATHPQLCQPGPGAMGQTPPPSPGGGGGTPGGGQMMPGGLPGGGGGLTPAQAYCILHPESCGPGTPPPSPGGGGAPPPPPPAGGGQGNRSPAAPPGSVQGHAVGGGFYGPAPLDAAQSKTAGLGGASAELEAAMRAAKARRDQPQEEGPSPDMASKRLDLGALGQQSGAKQREAEQLARSSRSRTEMGDYQGGLREAENAISADPENPEGYVRRAEALAMLGRYQEARDAAEKAALLMPEYANAWQNLAWADLKLGNLAAALKEIDLAISLNPDDATSWAIKAYILEQMGDLEGARKAMAKAARLDARYQAKADEMKAGRRGYSPDMTSALAGAASAQGAAPASGGGVPLPLVLGGLAALLAGGGAFWLLARKKKDMASILQASAGPVERSAGRVGKYELGRMIGRGGMGAVYEATDHALGRTVAVKKVTEELGSEAKARDLLFKEARTVAALHHPAIVEIYDIFEEGKDLYVVFELVKGRTVSQILAERRRLSLPECLGILRPVCEALEFAHAQKLVHRDLKPANIMVNELGAVKLMDFGIARSVADAVPMTVSASTAPMAARTAFIIGTPAYMPPEAESGVVSQSGDVYALGVCLYEMALGQAPFPPTSGWDYKLSCRYAKPSQLDPSLRGLDALIDQALLPDPRARLASAGAFLAGLEAAAHTA